MSRLPVPVPIATFATLLTTDHLVAVPPSLLDGESVVWMNGLEEPIKTRIKEVIPSLHGDIGFFMTADGPAVTVFADSPSGRALAAAASNAGVMRVTQLFDDLMSGHRSDREPLAQHSTHLDGSEGVAFVADDASLRLCAAACNTLRNTPDSRSLLDFYDEFFIEERLIDVAVDKFWFNRFAPGATEELAVGFFLDHHWPPVKQSGGSPPPAETFALTAVDRHLRGWAHHGVELLDGIGRDLSATERKRVAEVKAQLNHFSRKVLKPAVRVVEKALDEMPELVRTALLAQPHESMEAIGACGYVVLGHKQRDVRRMEAEAIAGMRSLSSFATELLGIAGGARQLLLAALVSMIAAHVGRLVTASVIGDVQDISKAGRERTDRGPIHSLSVPLLSSDALWLPSHQALMRSYSQIAWRDMDTVMAHYAEFREARYRVGVTLGRTPNLKFDRTDVRTRSNPLATKSTVEPPTAAPPVPTVVSKAKLQPEEWAAERRAKELAGSLERAETDVAELKERLSLYEVLLRADERLAVGDELASSPTLELTALRGVLVGGHEAWHAKLRDAIPGVRIIHPDTARVDPTTFDHADYVVFYTRYANHRTFETCYALAKKTRARLLFIEHVNIDAVVSELCEQLKVSPPRGKKAR